MRITDREYIEKRDAFVETMLEENPVAEDLKEAAIGYWERIFSEGRTPTTEEERKLGEERRKRLRERAIRELREEGYDV